MRFDLLSVLLVDDNHHMRRLLGEILGAIGVTKVAHASDGAEALQILRERRFDIVITDFAMRPLGGIQFVRLLRKGPESANALVPVIMVTGHSTKARVAEARDAGVNEFLSKPVTPRGVVERIGRVIEHP
ncbi:MAG: response regulator, partial [Caulobacteraceae bacterium]